MDGHDARKQYDSYGEKRSRSSSLYHALELRLLQRELFDELARALGLERIHAGRPSKAEDSATVRARDDGRGKGRHALRDGRASRVDAPTEGSQGQRQGGQEDPQTPKAA